MGRPSDYTRLTLLDQYRYAVAAQRTTVFSYADHLGRRWIVYGPGWPWLGVEFPTWKAALEAVNERSNRVPKGNLS